MKTSRISGIIGIGILSGMLALPFRAAASPAETLQGADWKKGAGLGAWLAEQAAAASETEETGKRKEPEQAAAGEETEGQEDALEGLVMADVQNILNVRSEPDGEAELEGYLYADCGGTILERQDGWTKLESGELTGWAKDDYLLFGEAAAEAARDAGREVATTTTGALRIRKEPSEDAGVYDLLEEGAKYEVVNDEQVEFAGGEAVPEGWIAVDYGGKTGYVSADYVDVSFEVDFGETVEQVTAREEERKEREEAAKEEQKKAEHTGKAQEKEDGKSREAEAEAQKAAALNADDSVLLAALIQCEAGDEPFEGQVAVGAVVMNRVKSGAYPNTIKDVIYASGQFTPAGSGQVARVIASGKVKQSCLQAAQQAMAGSSPVGAATHFRRAGSREGIVIGSHVFW